METLEIHSKSFLIKWVYVPTGGTLVWQVKPTKKSINFGVFRHAKDEQQQQTDSTDSVAPVAQRRVSTTTSSGTNKNSDNGQPIDERMINNGLEKILWHGKCISNELLRGHFDVGNGHGGMFAMVFDNTFSKTTAKTVLFSYHVKKPQTLNQSAGQSQTASLIRESVPDSASSLAVNAIDIPTVEPTGSPNLSQPSLPIAVPVPALSDSNGTGNGSVNFNKAYLEPSPRDGSSAFNTSSSNGDVNGSLSSSMAASSLHQKRSSSQLPIPPPPANSSQTTLDRSESNSINNQSTSQSTSQSTKNPRAAANVALSGSVVSTESVQQRGGGRSQHSQFPTCVSDGRYISGVILKKRRKKLQGFARRYFRLDYKYGVLNYYFSQHSSVLRGSMPIRLSVVSANESTRSIIIDSGAEIWNLKTLSAADWKTWVSALDVARHSTAAPAIGPPHQSKGVVSIVSVNQSQSTTASDGRRSGEDPDPKFAFASTKLDELRSIVEQLEKTNLSLKATINNGSNNGSNSAHMTYLENNVSQLSLGGEGQKDDSASTSASVSASASSDSVARPRRSSLWRMGSRRGSRPDGSGEPITLDRRPSLSSIRKPSPELKSSTAAIFKDQLKDATENLDNIIGQFYSYIQSVRDIQHAATATPNTPVRSRVPSSSAAAVDMERSSIFSDDMFYDVEDVDDGVIYLDADDDLAVGLTGDGAEDENDGGTEISDSESTSDDDRDVSVDAENLRVSFLGDKSFRTEYGDDLYPLPLENAGNIRRRTDIKPANSVPPSLMGFLRKNVGKDLTSITMPVTSNEPLTILQRYSEQFEYSNLLTEAAGTQDRYLRMLLVASFAVSTISNQRAKIRALRKPFNPLLGETFELVREDLGFRLLGEKVSHRPPIMAFQVDSAEWTAHFSSKPGQKFWGKSMEITDEGPIRITFRNSGEVYEFLPPPSFIRNLIAGERYIEPVGKVTLISSNGCHADIDYHKAKASGLFGGGRTEDVLIKVYDDNKKMAPNYVEGKWTEGLNLVGSDGKVIKPVWTPGNLVENYNKKYGFTEFAASLNEITDIERDRLCPTDSRLRPDQRHYENGNNDEAEKLKLLLEEKQRQRRKVMEEAGEVWKPHFFEKVRHDTDDQHYVSKTGESNYWKRRQNNDWSGILELW